MSGHRFDYSSERQRHEKFVCRAGLLARLDQLLVDSDADRWVVITGGMRSIVVFRFRIAWVLGYEDCATLASSRSR